MAWFINSLGLVLGIGIAIFILGSLIGAILYYTDERCGEEMARDYNVYQSSNSSKNINIGGNCNIVKNNGDGTSVIKTDKYTIVVTKDGISVNGKKIDFKEEDK